MATGSLPCSACLSGGIDGSNRMTGKSVETPPLPPI